MSRNKIFGWVFICLVITLWLLWPSRGQSLEEALAWLPNDPHGVFFNDWEQIESDLGFNFEEYYSGNVDLPKASEDGSYSKAEREKENFISYTPFLKDETKAILDGLGITRETRWEAY